MEQYRGTTILCVRRGNSVVIGGDGQVSMGNTVMKGNARKVRRLYREQVLAGFAGGTADAFSCAISSFSNNFVLRTNATNQANIGRFSCVAVPRANILFLEHV